MNYNILDLIQAAKKGRENAYTPYSKFNVGAAILLKNGEYILGCNIENASYGLSNCAERTALFNMVSKGISKNDVIAMAIVGQTEGPISPCGACRQVMQELLPANCPIILANLEEQYIEYKVEDLLPYSFSEGDLR